MKRDVFIGIDLAWTEKNESGICIIDSSMNILHWSAGVYSIPQILDLIHPFFHRVKIVAIDAPLIVKNQGGSRQAERDLLSQKIHGHRLHAFMVSRGFLQRRFGMLRGEDLFNAANQKYTNCSTNPISLMDGRNNIAFIETFPTGIVAGLFPDLYPLNYKLKAKTPFQTSINQLLKLLEQIYQETHIEDISLLMDEVMYSRLQLKRKDYKHIEDKVDSLLCAYGVLCMQEGSAGPVFFGTNDDGVLTLPVRI